MPHQMRWEERVVVSSKEVRQRVLLAEDENAIAFEFEAALRDADFEVVGPAFDTEKITELASKEKVDAAVMDFGLVQHALNELLSPLVARGLLSSF
jgi:DNA-binding NarL/FixJ family response regulator